MPSSPTSPPSYYEARIEFLSGGGQWWPSGVTTITQGRTLFEAIERLIAEVMALTEHNRNILISYEPPQVKIATRRIWEIPDYRMPNFWLNVGGTRILRETLDSLRDLKVEDRPMEHDVDIELLPNYASLEALYRVGKKRLEGMSPS